MMLFGVTLAKRYTKSQKRIFYTQAEPFFKKLGFAVAYQTSQKRLSQVSNLLIGDLHKAETIVLSPYDTPSSSLLPYKYYPFNLSENVSQENIELFLRTLFYVLSCLLAYFVFGHFPAFTPLFKVLSIVLLAALILFCYKLIVGIPNPVNFNKNSASVALLAALAEKTRNNPGIAYVLLDKNADSSGGLKLLAEDESLKNKTFLYVDSVAFGEKLACVHTPEMASEARKFMAALSGLEVLERTFSGDRLNNTILPAFPKLLHICVGTIEKQKFYVQNTRSKKDMKIDVPRLEQLCSGLSDYLRG